VWWPAVRGTRGMSFPGLFRTPPRRAFMSAIRARTCLTYSSDALDRRDGENLQLRSLPTRLFFRDLRAGWIE
jgi:hypothetical protein